MTFEQWYEANKEGLTVHSLVSSLREAWNAGCANNKRRATVPSFLRKDNCPVCGEKSHDMDCR